MTNADALKSLRISQGKFDRHNAMRYKFKLEGKRKKFLVPYDDLPDEAKVVWNDRVIDFDDEAEQVEDVLGDLTEGINVLPNELDAARLDNLKMRTAVLGQKLDEQKQSIWYEWNQAVFEEFSEAFAKVKNDLINLHLDEKQIESLNSSIDAALKNLEDRLETLWNKFKNGDEENEKL